MFPYSNDRQEFNKFMVKLIEKAFKAADEIQEEYNKLSPNAKAMADNEGEKIRRLIIQMHNFDEVKRVLNNLKNNY